MKRTILFAIAAASLLFAGCSREIMKEKEDLKAFNPDKYPVFYSDLSKNENETKTFINDKMQLRWTADDRITIFTTTFNQQYKFTGKTGDNAGSFKKVKSDDFFTGNQLEQNYAVYPYNEETSIDESGKISLLMPVTQQYAEGSFGLGANTMVAVTEDSDDYYLPFKNVCGWLVVRMYGDATVTSISLTGNNGEKIAGAATVTPEYGEAPVLTMEETATEMITVNCVDGVVLGTTAETATEFWFAVPPTTFSQGFTIIATDNRGWVMEKTTTSSKTITRNVKNPSKTRISSAYQGVEFLGAYLKPFRKYVGNECIRRVEGKFSSLFPLPLRRRWNAINSYLGITSHYSAYNIRRRWIAGPLRETFKEGYYLGNILKYGIHNGVKY